MPSHEDIANQQELLATYRRTLAHLLRQAALYGGVPFAPPQIVHGIDEARRQIDQIKEILRAQGVDISDESSDTSNITSATSSLTTLELRNRNRLLYKVRAFWIEGVLHTSLQDTQPIMLGVDLYASNIEGAFDAAWAAGQTMTVEQTIAYALDAGGE
jgi:hypothetical protein